MCELRAAKWRPRRAFKPRYSSRTSPDGSDASAKSPRSGLSITTSPVWTAQLAGAASTTSSSRRGSRRRKRKAPDARETSRLEPHIANAPTVGLERFESVETIEMFNRQIGDCLGWR